MIETSENIIPKQLEFILKQCGDEKEAILKIRNKILNFDDRIREFTDTRIIKYGKIKSQPLAELRLPEKCSQPILILKLPILKTIPFGKDTKKMGRMRIETDNWQNVSRILYIPKERLKQFKKVYNPTTYMTIKSPQIPGNNQLEMLVDIALEKWREKMLFSESLALKPAEDSFRQGWQEAMTGDTLPISQLWEGIDAD